MLMGDIGDYLARDHSTEQDRLGQFDLGVLAPAETQSFSFLPFRHPDAAGLLS
jgi:hypothetical protein